MSRRGENIHKRKDGRWEARYEKGRTENGTIIYGFLYGKSYREAKEKKLQALQKQMPMQRSKNYSAFQIQELSSLWLEYVHFNLKESTYMCYAALVQKHIVPYFKKNPQQLLSKNGLQIFYNDKIASGLSTQSVKMILMLLERILIFSEEQELLPTVKRTKVHPKTIPFEKDLLSPEELSLLSRHLVEADTAFAAGVLLCMYTGIRIGELCGIKGADIDLKRGILTIRRTVSRIANPDISSGGSQTIVFISTPKSLSSIRTIPLPDQIIPFLQKWSVSDQLYFLTGNTKPTEPRNVQRQFKNILKGCNLPQVTFHSLRHSFATLCIENGIDSKALSEILGHSSVKITLDIYVHSNMAQKKEYLNRLSI